ncbi:MAG: efflux RND transporter periplasmic adaptor subunit [Terriglobales bacterium]
MADSVKTEPEKQPLGREETASHGEEWHQEELPSRRQRARSYFQQHPAARWLLLLLVIGVIVCLVRVWRYYSVRESTDDAQIDGYIYPVSARVSGTAIKVNFDDNTYVEKGTVLAELDPTDYQVALQRAQADLADAEATATAARTNVPITHTGTSSQLSMAQAAVATAQKEELSARAKVADVEAKYKKAASDLRRMQQLIGKDEISQQQYDAAVAAEQAAKATVDAERANVAAAQSRVVQAEASARSAQTGPQQVAVMRSRAGAAEAAVQHAQAAVAQAQLNLQYSTIRAPVSGIVSQRNVEVGQTVQAGQPLFGIVDLDNLWVTADFKETQLKNMRPGQPARVQVDAYGRTYSGHVDSLGGATGARFSLLPPENATGNYVKVVQRIPVKIVLDKGQDPRRQLRPGMSVVPTVLTK